MDPQVPPQKNLSFVALTGFFFFISISSLMMSIIPVTLVFPRERMVFLKEESTKLYSTFTFFISRTIIELPFTFIVPMLTSLILYWMVGLENSAGNFFTFYFALFLIVLAGSSLGLLIGSMF